MSGHVYYRFKSQKDFQRIVFDGIGISVWDLKREIIQESKMGKGSDFDFAIYNADTEEEYLHDHTIIPRSSSVIARRLPPKRPGHGNAQQYVEPVPSKLSSRSNHSTAHADWRGGGSISKDFRQTSTSNPAPQVSAPLLTGGERDSEAENMAAMFAAQDQQWQKTQEAMATATRVGRSMGFRDRGNHRLHPGSLKSRENQHAEGGSVGGQSAQPPPPGYICYRCGQKGHWIQACPTNDNPEFEGRPRIKRTTGIPKSFLQKVEGKPLDGQNVMVTADGSFVIAKPDDASWKQHKSVVVKNLSAADIENQRPSDPDLACSVCSTLLKSAVKMICCQSTFCQSCISGYLREHSSVCPECETKVSNNLSKAFVPDAERRTRSQEYVEEMLKASKEGQQDAQPDGSPEAKSSGQADVSQVGEVIKRNETHAETSSSTQTSDVKSVGTTSRPQQAGQDDGVDAPQAPPQEAASRGDSAATSKASPAQIPTSTQAADVTSKPTGPNPEFDRFPLPPIGGLDAHLMGNFGIEMGVNLHPMNSGMEVSAGMGRLPQQMGAKGMEHDMLIGMMPHNHNTVVSAKPSGMFGNPVHPQGVGMEMMVNSPEGILRIQLNQILMMLQSGQLSEPMRIQLMLQHQQLQHQMSIMQRMGQHNSMMEQMGMTNAGMMMNGGTSYGNLALDEHMLNQSTGFGGPGSHQAQALHLHYPFQPTPSAHQPGPPLSGSLNPHRHQPPLNHSTSPYQRLPVGNQNSRRLYMNGNVKRKRSEDLIELESGEKVPRYM